MAQFGSNQNLPQMKSPMESTESAVMERSVLRFGFRCAWVRELGASANGLLHPLQLILVQLLGPSPHPSSLQSGIS